ncbi:hypothetical protein ACFLS1_10140 [Verrucomicrobiota bacterium]
MIKKLTMWNLTICFLVLAGCSPKVGVPPGDGELAKFEIPSDIFDSEQKEIDWLFFGSPEFQTRSVRIQIGKTTVYRNKMPPASGIPDIRIARTRLSPGLHTVIVEDLESRESIQTNLTSGITEQIEIRFDPLSVGVSSNWIGYL